MRCVEFNQKDAIDAPRLVDETMPGAIDAF
jgi:hypothetical protein